MLGHEVLFCHFLPSSVRVMIWVFFFRAPSGLMLSLVQIFFLLISGQAQGGLCGFFFLQHIVHMAQGFIIFQCFGLKYNNHLGKVEDWGIARIFHIIVRQTKGMCHCH